MALKIAYKIPFEILKSIFLFPLGCVVFGIILSLFALVSPFYLYRWLICKIVAFYPFSKFGKIVCLHGSGLASDFLPYYIHKSSKHSLVINAIYEGQVNEKSFQKALLQRWIMAKDSKGELMYPELQQHLEPFMGYMFWKQDKAFTLKDHIESVVLAENMNDDEIEEYVREVTEDSLNTPFVLDKSPWKFYILHNYRNKTISSEPMAFVSARLHHVLVDGPAIISAFTRGLDLRMSQLNLATLTKKEKPSILARGLQLLAFFSRMGSDVLHIMTNIGINKTWFVIKEKQMGRQLYARTNFISVDIIKAIKRKYETSFSAVLMSCISSGVSRFMQKTETIEFNETKHLAAGIPIPLRRSSKKLDIKSTGTVLLLPVSCSIPRSARLLNCDEIVKETQTSTIPFLWHLWEKIILVQFAPIARFVWRNRFCSSFITGFPGPTVEVSRNGSGKVWTYDYAIGTFAGNASMAIAVSTYLNRLRVTVTAEDTMMSRQDINSLTQFIEDEIFAFYELA